MSQRESLDREKFQEWWEDVLKNAEIVDNRYPVKGLYVWKPYGFSIRRNVYSILRSLMDEEHDEVLFPLLIPATIFQKEAEHIRGFEDEVYWVTRGGKDELDIPLALRPTSETAIYPMFKIWIRSHRDLPIRIYQVVNAFRYETKHTRPLIRVREITSFKEAHTAHATMEDAEEQVRKAINIYSRFFDRLCIPYIISRRPDWDKFPGAEYSIAFDTLMPDGRSLQIGTVHNLGTKFARAFEITYEDKNGDHRYVHQTCYGISERCIAALLAIHGDERGLILPPDVAPIQVIVIPIIFEESRQKVMEECSRIISALKESGIRVRIDDSDERPGAKFYRWEFRGVPVRIEIGPRDVERGVVTLVRRDTLERREVDHGKVVEEVRKAFEDVSGELRRRARQMMESNMRRCESAGEIKNYGISIVGWCGNEECGRKLEGEVRVIGVSLERRNGKCIVCGKESELELYLGKPY